MVSTKYQAVEFFAFIQKICARDGCKDCVAKSCGVLFLKEYAYSANSDIVGRINISDNFPIDNPIFWSYGIEGEINRPSRDKFMLNTRGYIEGNQDIKYFFEQDFTHNFDYFIHKFMDISFYIRKQNFINYLEEKRLSDAKKNKLKIWIKALPDGIHFRIEPIKITKAMQQFYHFILPYFNYPNTYQKNRIDTNISCTLNLYSFFEVIEHGFTEYDIIRIKHNESGPVVLEGRAKNKTSVSFALSQIS